ncbi:MAG: Gfo/Idh/MocA family oxidoreductase [Bryobacteraceae bacterium]|nr:Gfo/Idh/MocA family oxidoreductase [Bryobacteraceae bacterium]
MAINNRRQFLGAGSLAGVLKAAGAQRDARPIRAGIVGVGDRGSYHMDVLLGTDLVEVPAICDIDADYLYRAKRWVEQAGKPSPELYGRGKTDFLRLCERKDLDLVVCATSWEWHAPVCIAAMKAGKHATTEVPATLTVDESWEMIETSEKTGKHCVMLEQANYSPNGLQVLEMAQKGAFGEVLCATGGYVHDLRLVKFDPEREPWRLQHSVDRNGNLYPTHPIGPMAWWLDINRGDKFDYLVSMSSKAVCLNEYAAHFFGDRHPYAGMKMNQGDVNTTLMMTAGGKTAMLYFDTNTPHPQTAELRLEGSKGHFSGNIGSVYIEGRSPKEHAWEPLANYQKEFQHPIWRNLDESRFKRARGHGGGATTPLLWARLIRALQRGEEPDMNVYDAVVWSVISPLSEKSVAAGSAPVDFPDFTRGKWKSTPAIKLAAES